MNKNWKTKFITIYIGQAFSILGSAAVQFAIIWWLTIQTESAITLTFASIIAFIPNIILGPFAGVWIDRYNRKTVMILSDGLIALSSVVLGIIFFMNANPPIWCIYIILFIRGIGATFHGPAMQSTVPMLVPADKLTQVGGWGNLINSVSNMLGPVLGAGLMGLFSISSIMLVDIIGAIFAIVCLLFVSVPNIPQTSDKIHLISDMKQGFQAILKNRPLVAAFIPLMLANVVSMPLGSLYPLLVRTHFLGEAWHNSVVEFVFAGGLLIASLIVGIYGGMKKRFLMISLAIALMGTASMVSGMLASSAFYPFVVCTFLMGMAGSFINIPLMAYVQESTPQEVMGKVFSLLMTAMTIAMPVGLLIAGPVCELIGVDTWFLWSGVVVIGVGILLRVVTKKYDAITSEISDTETLN